MAIEPLEGGSNLGYKVSLLRGALCRVHAFLDDDHAGRRSFENARKEGLLDINEVHLSSVVGQGDAEFEDLIDPKAYSPGIEAELGIKSVEKALLVTGSGASEPNTFFTLQASPGTTRSNVT